MKIKVFFAWYDFWVGWFYDRNNYTLYICPLPMIVFKINKKQVMGYCKQCGSKIFKMDKVKDCNLYECQSCFYTWSKYEIGKYSPEEL